MKRLATLAIAFGYMVLLIEAIRTAAAWWHGSPPTGWDWLLLAALPPAAWFWWQRLSPFGKHRGQCLAPRDTERTS